MTNETALVPQSTGLVRRAAVALEPVIDIQTAISRMEKLQEFCAHYLQESKDGGNDGGDYGIIPGAGKKKVLLKSGAEKLCDVYGLADTYSVISSREDFATGLFEYTLECRLQSRVDDSLVGSGLGSCSSFESKYRWRDSQRLCPTCSKATIIKGREEYGGGWLCFAKKGGCGAKFKAGDASIEGQATGRSENPDIIDTRNTVLKMAKKRAKIDAVIGVTRSSGIFTQDLEDIEAPRPVERVNTTTGEIVESQKGGDANVDQYRSKSDAVTGAAHPINTLLEGLVVDVLERPAVGGRLIFGVQLLVGTDDYTLSTTDAACRTLKGTRIVATVSQTAGGKYKLLSWMPAEPMPTEADPLFAGPSFEDDNRKAMK